MNGWEREVKQANISPCLQVVRDIGPGCRGFQCQPQYFPQPPPSRGFCTPLYSRLQFGAADWMQQGDARTGAERSLQHSMGGHWQETHTCPHLH